jgi:hypothetical protein
MSEKLNGGVARTRVGAICWMAPTDRRCSGQVVHGVEEATARRQHRRRTRRPVAVEDADCLVEHQRLHRADEPAHGRPGAAQEHADEGDEREQRRHQEDGQDPQVEATHGQGVSLN